MTITNGQTSLKSIKRNTNSKQSNRASTKIEVESGATGECPSSADRSHLPCVICRNRGKTKKSIDNTVINYCLTISMKNVS